MKIYILALSITLLAATSKSNTETTNEPTTHVAPRRSKLCQLSGAALAAYVAWLSSLAVRNEWPADIDSHSDLGDSTIYMPEWHIPPHLLETESSDEVRQCQLPRTLRDLFRENEADQAVWDRQRYICATSQLEGCLSELGSDVPDDKVCEFSRAGSEARKNIKALARHRSSLLDRVQARAYDAHRGILNGHGPEGASVDQEFEKARQKLTKQLGHQPTEVEVCRFALGKATKTNKYVDKGRGVTGKDTCGDSTIKGIEAHRYRKHHEHKHAGGSHWWSR